MSIERHIVTKIGGESQITLGGFQSARGYLLSNPDIYYLVPSAIGGNPKVTHLLIACVPEWGEGHPYNAIYRDVRGRFPSTEAIFEEVKIRYTSRSEELGYHGIGPYLDRVCELINDASRSESETERERYRHKIVSRGEWLSGHMWSELLGWRFVDPTELIMLRKDGRLNERSYNLIGSRLRGGGDRFVIPGFFGQGPDRAVMLLPKNGSDLTGAYIAAGVRASEYQNLKNVPGVMSADPKIVDTPDKKVARLISRMTYLEYGELGYGGFQVLHKDSISPVARLGIPLRVLNPELASDSEYEGTLICATRPDVNGKDVIGIAGKDGYVAFRIRKQGMEPHRGVGRRILQIFERNGISISHTPTGHDSMSVVFESGNFLREREYKIMDELSNKINPDELLLKRKIGVFAVVGQRIGIHRSRVASKLLSALDRASINFIGGSQGVNDISMTFLVQENDLEGAIRVAHAALIEDHKE